MSSSKKSSSSKHSQRTEQPSQRMSTFFVDGAGIDREVITADICRYLGNDALVRPGPFTDRNTGQVIQGYFVTGYRALTSAQLDTLRSDSSRWAAERMEKSQNMSSSSRGQSTSSEGYGQSATAAARARGGYPSEMAPPPPNEQDYSDRGSSYMSSMPPPTQSSGYDQQQRDYRTQPQSQMSGGYVQQDYPNYTYDNPPITVPYEVNRTPQTSGPPRTTFASSSVNYAPDPRVPVYTSGSSTNYYNQAPVTQSRTQQPQQSSQDYVTPPPAMQQQVSQQSYYPAARAPQPPQPQQQPQTAYDPQDDDMEYDEPDVKPPPPTNQSHSSSRHRDRERESERDRESERHRRKGGR